VKGEGQKGRGGAKGGEVASVHLDGSVAACVPPSSRPTSIDWPDGSQGTITAGSISLEAQLGSRALSISPKELKNDGREDPGPLVD